MTGKNRIMIYGRKGDGTYVIEFRTAAGEALAISIPRGETAVIRHFQECMPCRKLAAFIRDCFAGNTAAPEALLQRPPVHPPTKVQGPGTPPQLSPSGGVFLGREQVGLATTRRAPRHSRTIIPKLDALPTSAVNSGTQGD